jgi:hypothetical protein
MKLPSTTRGTHKSHDPTLELDERHLTFVIVNIGCSGNCDRGADLGKSNHCACTLAVRISFSMHNTGLGLALLRLGLTIGIARVTVP